MNSDYSFIINKPIDYSCLDSTNQHISNSNYILNIISPTCEDCYVNLNKWELIASQNKKLQKKIIFVTIPYPLLLCLDPPINNLLQIEEMNLNV